MHYQVSSTMSRLIPVNERRNIRSSLQLEMLNVDNLEIRRYLVNATYLFRFTGSVCVFVYRDRETIGRVRPVFRTSRTERPVEKSNADNNSSPNSQDVLVSHEPRAPDAGCAMSKFHRISATPAIKASNERRGEILPVSGACQGACAIASDFADLDRNL